MPTHHQGPPEEIQALDAYIKLTRAVSALETRLAHRATLGDLTVSQFGVLEVLMHLGPLPQCQIGSKLLKSGGNITLVIDNLEKRGLVTRIRSVEDRRVINVSLTPEGERLIRDVFPRQAQAITAEMGVLTPAEQQTLAALCRKLGVALAGVE